MTAVALGLAVLFGAGALGGALNSVAGGGSFIVFPTLLAWGVTPVAANATTAAALWPAGIASSVAYRADLSRDLATLRVLAAASALGGCLGGVMLLATSDETFTKLLPWLLLVASVVFTFGPRLRAGGGRAQLPLAGGALIQLVISSYGGYFGGGMGILMLATFTLMGMTNMHAMNGLKTLLATVINGVAVIVFVLAKKVDLVVAAPVAIGSIFGGWIGAALAKRVDSRHIRRAVLLVAWAMTTWFFYRGMRK